MARPRVSIGGHGGSTPPIPPSDDGAGGYAFDESVYFRGFDMMHRMPPTLYLDDFTVLRELYGEADVRALREGDHCVVGVNLMHNLWWWSDRILALLTSVGLVPFYHHFVVLDSVASIAADGQPLRTDGQPCRVAEYSDTVRHALWRIFGDGYAPGTVLQNALGVIRSPARLRFSPLHDYLRLGGRGTYIVCERLSAEQRRRTVERACQLVADADSQPAYRVLINNCEHFAWRLDATSRREISPQVSHHLWQLFRLGLQTFALVWLWMLHTAPHDATRTHNVAVTLFHLFSTVPVGAQTFVLLVRTCVNLTVRRQRGDITNMHFDYLMVKEGARAGLVMAMAVGGLSVVPRLVWEAGRVKLACALSLGAHTFASALYTVVQTAGVRVLLATGIGVPVARFDDLRTSIDVSGLDESPARGGQKKNL